MCELKTTMSFQGAKKTLTWTTPRLLLAPPLILALALMPLRQDDKLRKMQNRKTFMDHPHPHLIREPTIKKGSPVKLPAHAVEKGRKMVQDKLEEEQLLQRASLADKIQKFYKFFPHIKENAPKKGKISSADTLKLLQQEYLRCERELNNSNTYENMKRVDNIASYLMEKVACMFGQPAHMYTVVAKESQHIVDQELKEFSIKYGDIVSMGPEMRYFLKKMQIMATLIDNNKRGMAAATQPVDPAQEELRNKKYANL